MNKYRTIKSSFDDCLFTITFPKVTIVDSLVNFDFSVSFAGKSHPTKYIVKNYSLEDKFGNKIAISPVAQSNLSGKTKHSVVINDNQIYKKDFNLTISFVTLQGDYIDVSYHYECNKILILKSVATRDMSDDEKQFFILEINKALEIINDELKKNDTVEKENKEKSSNQNLDKISSALYIEMLFLKQNGGKRHKVTDGRLLTPNSNEYCYSFELESELYLSDDAPVALLKGIETINGTVVVCDGFQIIVSLERNIGDSVTSAQISVEPWKLLEKLRERILNITTTDKIAWKLYHEGPALADKQSNLSRVACGQNKAISHALDDEITVIWGPPGTGKTYTMAQITERFVSQGKTVLIVSHSNISVDNVVKQISRQFSNNHLNNILSQGKVLRYGYVRDEELSHDDNCVAFNFALNKHPELKKQYQLYSDESRKLKIELQFKHNDAKAVKLKDIENLLKEIRSKLKTESQLFTSRAQVVATTVSKIYMDKLFDEKKYDVVMFDEVSMAYVPQLLCAATYASEKFICVGDFRQLSPIVQSERAKDVLQTDIFSYLKICQYGEIYNHPWLVMLNEQRRMHPSISKFSNQRIYKGLLKDHSSVINKWDSVTEKEPFPNQAMNLIDLAGTFCAASKNADNSRFNIFSALLSFGIAIKSERAQNDVDFKNEEKVGIITPYAAQTRLIRALIQDYRQKETTAVSCATVHQFQGSERNVVIFDAVESYPFTKPGWLISKNENGSVIRLINVALTRARCKFITLASTSFWHSKFQETQHTYFKLLDHIKENDNVMGMQKDVLIGLIKSLDFGKNIRPYYSPNDALSNLLDDIRSASKNVYITLPTDKLIPQFETLIISELKEKSRQGVSVLGKAKNVEGLTDAWKDILFQSKEAAFPIIVIDNKITWYGFPVTELFFAEKNGIYTAKKSPIFRIIGKYTNEMLHSLCELDYRIDEKGNRIKLMEKSNTSFGQGLSDFINETVTCKKCGMSMCLNVGHSGKYILKCSNCGFQDFLTVNTVNKYLDEINAKCTCGKDLYAVIGPHGLYTRCGNSHITKLSELS